MSDNIQSKLDKLERIEQGNRDRSKKYLNNIKAQGKRQLSVILPEATIKEITRLRDESITAGKPLTYGDIITNAINKNINKNVNIDTNLILDNNVKSDITLNKTELDKILREIPLGQWKKEADKLNEKGIKTRKGLPWTNDNLRFACKKFKK